MELEDGPRYRSVAALVAAAAILLAGSGCARTRPFTLLEHQGRALLIPPGVKTPLKNAGAADCPGAGEAAVTPRAAHFARYGCYLQTGFVDLEAGMRLKVVKPVLAPGETAIKTEVVAQQGLDLTVRASSNVTGVETKHWQVRAADGGVTVAEAGFGSGVRQYRLFFHARDLDHERKITLIGGATRQELEAATRDLETHCRKPGAPCLPMMPGMVIGAELPVQVNGQAVYVPIGATVREALPRAGGASRVQLERLWRGRMRPVRVASSVPANASLLPGVPLNGGDSIVW